MNINEKIRMGIIEDLQNLSYDFQNCLNIVHNQINNILNIIENKNNLFILEKNVMKV